MKKKKKVVDECTNTKCIWYNGGHCFAVLPRDKRPNYCDFISKVGGGKPKREVVVQ